MRSRYLRATLAIVCGLLWLASCGGRTAVLDDDLQAIDHAPVGDDTGQAIEADVQSAVDYNDLAALLETWKEPAATEWSEENRFRYGEDIEWDLPHRRTQRRWQGKAMEYYPASTPNGSAYAFYQFPLDGYDGTSEIHFDWDTPNPPEAEAEKWVGLANMDELRWDWFPGNPEEPVLLDSLKPYLTENGNLHLIVLLFGEGDFYLEWIRVGGNLEPDLVVASDPEEGPAGDVLISAIASQDLDGEITKCEFDLDNDGFFEVDNGNSLFIYDEINTPGPYLKRVRITDDAGASATGQLTVTINEWVEESIVSFCYDEYSVCTDDAGNIHVACLTDPTEETDYMVPVTHATNSSGTWTSDDVMEQMYFLRPVINIDSFNRPVIASLATDESWNRSMQFSRKESGEWQELTTWQLDLDDRYLLDCRLDSTGFPHLAHGYNGDLTGSGRYDYSYFDGIDWHTPLRNIPARGVQIDIDAEDKAHFMFSSLELQSVFWCVPSGDGYYFRLEQEYAELGNFKVLSGYPVYTTSEIDIYNYEQPRNNPSIRYGFDSVFSVNDYQQEDYHDFESDFYIDPEGNPLVCFKWYSFDSSELANSGKLGYAIREGHTWDIEWVSQSGGVTYSNPSMLSNSQDEPVIIAIKPRWETYGDGYYQTRDNLVSIHPRE